MRTAKAQISLRICAVWSGPSACASAQSDQGLRCPQTESLGAFIVSKESKLLIETLRIFRLM